MAKWSADAALDLGLGYFRACNIMHLCTAQPATYAGIAAVSLGSVAMVPNTDFPLADGDVSGRKITVAAKTGITISASGTANHLVLALTSDSTLRYVMTGTPLVLTSPTTADTQAWVIEIRDPV